LPGSLYSVGEERKCGINDEADFSIIREQFAKKLNALGDEASACTRLVRSNSTSLHKIRSMLDNFCNATA
jgi:hypothetical protein